MRSILTSLAHHGISRPNSLAFIDDHSGEGLTYRQLAQQIEMMVAGLQAHQVTCVGLAAENGLDWIVADLACLTAGIVCVPIPLFFSAEQQQHVMTASGMNGLLAVRSSVTEAEPVAQFGGLSFYPIEPALPSAVLPSTVKLTFTSGSTGTPKGVCLSETHLDEITHSLCQVLPVFEPNDRHLITLPLATLLENIAGVYVPLMLGIPAVVCPGSHLGLMGSSRFDPSQFAQVLLKVKPTSMVITPAMLTALISLAETSPALADNLKFVAVGGAKVLPEQLKKAHQLGIPAYEGYGLSECGSVVSVNTPQAVRLGTCGKVLATRQVRIAADGEIWVSGGVALGYLNEPFGDTWLPTGDIGELTDDGYLMVTGRKKNQIITSFGRNVSPEWIEMLSQQWPALRGMVVVGEGLSGLAAMIPGAEPAPVQLALSVLNQQLPDYARITSFVLVADSAELVAYFTDNGRPIRPAVERMVNQSTTRYSLLTDTRTSIRSTL